MPISKLFKRTLDDSVTRRARRLIDELKTYLETGQTCLRERHSNLLRIDVDPDIDAALTQLGHTRNAFATDRMIVLNDLFFRLRIVDELGIPKGYRFVFCDTSTISVTPPPSSEAEKPADRLAS